ncbi:Aste57867_2340 [Aphanomyces stellatus]|uniref:Aste57867_2340 protein n=1 Tax=Aphanomyces stellatus TaxID=120398 RepID=A0A485K7F3_9STRA|nr:hypothetical protein As57867_002335 [Aphanomyces stellatus]VFT79542.1 Aste57867_2340 [Aphanomyces stellatus]
MESEMIQKDAIISSPHVLQQESLQFRLTGREEAIQSATKCYMTIIEGSTTTAIDRTKRTIPVCSGISGLGKTRMLEEGILILRDVLKEKGLEDEFNCIACVIVPYSNGYSPRPVERTMSIEASFSWRLLFRFFLAANCLLQFDEWFRKRLPSNGDELTLKLALEVIQHKLYERLGNPPRLYLFLGIDEYQKIEKVGALQNNSDTTTLRELVETIGNVLCAQASKLVLLPMFAGTDLHVISSIANASNFVTQRLPMSLLTIRQVFSFVQSTQKFARLLDYSQVCRNLFFLGGVPRWVVEYLLALKTESNVLSLEMIEKCYTTITDTYVTSAFSVLNPRQRLRLAAFALSGRRVQPDELFDDNLTWSRLRDSSICLLSPRSDLDGRVRCKINVPYSLFLQIEAPSTASEAEVSFVFALKDLFKFVDSKLFDILPWQSCEVFGACFYALRINALLVLGHSTVILGDLLHGAKMDDETSAIQVKLVLSRVFRCAEKFGPTTGQILTRLGNTLETIDWISSGCIAMNDEGGEGVDIFFALEHAVTCQVVVVVDQRKRRFGKFQPSQASIYLDKLSQSPSFLTNAILLRGVMNCVSISNLATFTVPSNCFLISGGQNDEYHGALSYHPACSPFISVNTANKTAIKSLFKGTDNQVDMVVEEILRKRAEPDGGFSEEDDLHSIIHAKKVRVELDSEFLEFSY